MEDTFDIREFLKIDLKKPVELRICHIADLWYKEVCRDTLGNKLDTIYKLFPELVIKEEQNRGAEGLSPKYYKEKFYITAYRDNGILYQGRSGNVVQIISCLYGNVNKPKNKTDANDIQIRISEELCRDRSLISKFRDDYKVRLSKLSPYQRERFKIVFNAYINTIMEDLETYRGYKTSLFPFASERLIFDLNNYLSSEFNKGNYSDFFLWMNLGALLRNEINNLIDTYDSSFNLRGTKPVPALVGGLNGSIPKCLTRIPPVNCSVNLVGRDDVIKTVHVMLEENGRMVLVSGCGGVGKTAVMRQVCNDLKNEGSYVAWIDCGNSLKKDILVLSDALGIPIGNPDTAYKMILSAIKNRLDGLLYLFLDNLTEELGEDELGDLYSLGVHIMVTSRKIYDAFPTVVMGVLEEDSAVTMFFRYYNGDTDREYEKYAHDIVTFVDRHTLLIELLAKAANKSGGTLEDFSKKLEEQGVLDVFKRSIKMSHDGKTTIEDCVMKL